METHNLGFPRIGAQRELKKVTEAYWRGDVSRDELLAAGATLRRTHWEIQRAAGIDLIPSNDFSFYDSMLDLSALVGNVPSRFDWNGGPVSVDRLFQMARGAAGSGDCCTNGATASEMTKWFDTNYHYLVPEFSSPRPFRLSSSKPFDEFTEALALGIRTKPVLIGPLTYLRLGKAESGDLDKLTLLNGLLDVYCEVLARLESLGAEWIQIDEPILALDLPEEWRNAFAIAYRRLRSAAPGCRLLLATYFGELLENLPTALALPVDALHVDLTRAASELPAVLEQIPDSLILSLGVVDGRNIWRNDFERSLAWIELAKTRLGSDRVWIAPSCSLLHSPVSLQSETAFDDEFRSWLAFAEEKLAEVTALAKLAANAGDPVLAYKNRVAVASRKISPRIHNDAVKARVRAIQPADSQRESAFAIRQSKQHAALNQPLLPTTTIGSFPQTAEVRRARAQWKKGRLPLMDYERFLEAETERTIRAQEELGLDVLVHGEFERNDMVEYFGEQLDGFAFSQNGWVQSYGSRCVKPPILFGDVCRPAPMTVRWSQYAQSLTALPVKGMLTGPVTILQWSFVRDDQPRRETTRQIALALRAEVIDLEAAGLKAIQIDEPALREGLPLRRGDWAEYLAWAGEAFRLSAAGVRDETQIHTHMCYCGFNDIIAAIAALDADVISIEASRSNMELLSAFRDFAYPNEIGPGVWDIHSPRVPSVEEMVGLLRRAAAHLPIQNLWVNPDCGLKTRGWPETTESLRHLVAAAKLLRQEYVGRK